MSVAELREDANGQKAADCLKLPLSLCLKTRDSCYRTTL